MSKSLESATILVVDDTEASRYVVSWTLRKAGYTVIEASTGLEALKLVQSKPDLVTLDVKLPDMNGFEVCKQIKSREDLASIPVLHTSATFIQSKDRAHGLDSGADAYLTHPVDDVVLLATVKALLRVRKAEKEREHLLVKSQKDVEQLELERELRERFVATLSHDLRSPMTTARINAQMILRHRHLPSNLQKHATHIKESIDRADHMIRDLLDANRVRAGEKLPLDLEKCDLKGVVADTLADLKTVHGARFKLFADLDVSGFWDVSGLRRMIENLCNNAVKYGAADRPITLRIEQNSHLVKILVHNEGNPLSVDEQENLFAPYRRSRSAQASLHRGWGLGLTLVRGVAEAHGGSVSVESSANLGTTFIITLPRDSRSQSGELPNDLSMSS